MLGEAASKTEHLAGSPLLEEAKKRLHSVYLAKGVLATTAIEGNTLSEEQVLQHLAGKLTLPRSQKYLTDEIDNIVGICNRMVEEIQSGNLPALTPDRICKFNSDVLKDCPIDDDVHAGEFRNHSVGVGRYRGAPAVDCPYLMQRLCDWLNGSDFTAPDSMPELAMPLAILRAILAHLYIAWIHPFGDGNGRTARIVELQILLEAGAPTPAAHLLSNFYNKTREMYYHKLDESSQIFNKETHARNGHHALPFLEYATQGYVDGLREQIQLVKTQYMDLTWSHVINEAIPGGTTTDVRRKRLLEALTRSGKPVSINEIQDLDAALVFAYADKTSKTINRDLNHLVNLDLVIQKIGRKYQANTNSILAFLPVRKNIE
jgi:Fic family protein